MGVHDLHGRTGQFGGPPPDAPPEERLKAAVKLALTLPIWWPLVCLMLLLGWALIALSLVLVAFVALFLPLFAAIGMEEKTEKTIKVTVPKDDVGNLVHLSRQQGWQVED